MTARTTSSSRSSRSPQAPRTLHSSMLASRASANGPRPASDESRLENVPAGDKAAARPRSVRGSVVALTASNVFYGACQWLLLVVLVRTCYELEAGRFARGLAIAGPIMMCAGLQLRTLLATDTRHEFRMIDYAWARGITVCLALAAVAAICVGARYAWIDTQVVLLVALVKAVESVRELMYGYFQNTERIRAIAISMVLKGAAMVVGATAGGYLTHHASGAVLGMLAGILSTTLVYDWPVLAAIVHERQQPRADDMNGPISWVHRRPGTLRPSWRSTLRLLQMGICPGVVVGLNSLSMNIPRYFVDHMMGTVLLGVFTGLASLMRIGSYLEMALTQATLTRLSQLCRAGRLRSYRRMLGRIVAVALAIGLILIAGAQFAGRRFLTLAYSPAYAEYSAVLVTLLLAGAVGHVAGVLKGATDASRRYAVQLPIYVVSVAVATAGGMLLVPRYGLQGAAWSVVATKLVLTTGYIVVLLMQKNRSVLEPTREPLAGEARA